MAHHLRAPHRLAELTDLTPLSATTICADPQAAYQELRERWGPVAPVQLEPGLNGWLVMDYMEIMRVIRQEHLYACDPHNWRDLTEGRVPADSGLGPMMFPRDNVYFTDGARHRRLRVPVDEGIDTIDQRGMHRSVQSLCAELIDGFAHRGEGDLVAEYAAIIPVLAVANLLGIDTPRSHELQRALIAVYSATEEAAEGNRRFMEIMAEVIRARQEQPAQDLTTFFVQHQNLENEFEVLQSTALMIAAGFEINICWISQTLQLMLTDRRFAGRLRGGRMGTDDALDEVLWRNPPLANMGARYALRDMELCGQPIERGDPLVLALAAANQDPSMHVSGEGPEVGNRSHLAWSTGPHSCPAQLPARLIARTAVDMALHLLPDIRLAIPADQVTLQPSPWIRRPASLPVRFTAPRS